MGYVWFGGLFLVFFVLLCFPVQVRIEFAYSKNAGNKRQLCVWLCGFCVVKNSFDKKKEKISKTERTTEEKSFDGIMDKLHNFQNLFEYLKTDIEEMLIYFKNKLAVLQYTMHLDLGFDDAAQTGIASGAAYALVYGVAALVYNNLSLKKNDLDVYVTPHYNNPKLDFYFNGIFRLRVAHIINVLIWAVKIYKKYNKFTRNTKEGGGLL